MTDIVPIHDAGLSWTVSELLDNFHTEKEVKKIHLYGLLALRSQENATLLEILKSEAISQENREAKFFGFIKFSWIPVLAMLEHGGDAGKAILPLWLANWTELERELFLGYIDKEEEMVKWFSK